MSLVQAEQSQNEVNDHRLTFPCLPSHILSKFLVIILYLKTQPDKADCRLILVSYTLCTLMSTLTFLKAQLSLSVKWNANTTHTIIF